MKYTSKNEYYHSPHDNQGIFVNPWAETTMPSKWVDENGDDNFAMNFSLFHTKNGEPTLIEKGDPMKFKEYQPTIILNENDEEEDLREFLSRGGTYSKEKIVQWGRPSAYSMEYEYLDPTSIWSGNIQFTQNEPQATIAKDWADEMAKVQGIKLGVNFELEVETV